MAVAEAKLEPQLTKVLRDSKDPTTVCWTLSILSNCASSKASRERQSVAIPALAALITSPIPEVQHAAALHLATLSHSDSLAAVIGSSNRTMASMCAPQPLSRASAVARASVVLSRSPRPRWSIRQVCSRV
jgi:hypothetical protein